MGKVGGDNSNLSTPTLKCEQMSERPLVLRLLGPDSGKDRAACHLHKLYVLHFMLKTNAYVPKISDSLKRTAVNKIVFKFLVDSG